MTYAILLDVNQRQVDDDEYAVTYSGTLQACQRKTKHDGTFATWKKSDLKEISSTPKELENPTGSSDSGRIAGLEEVSQLKRYAWPLAAGVAAGLAVAAALSKRGWARLGGRR
jgi:hypothetical protein